MIEIRNAGFAYGRDTILHQVSARMENGEVLGLIGPNGAGKSTLLRLCAGILTPSEGSIAVDGKDVTAYRRKAFARQLAFLPQSRPVPALSVRSLVMLGRFAHEGSAAEAAEEAIRETGLEKLVDRDVRTLSGGQRQMAYLAMALAQKSPNVLLDEPLTHLDIGSQLEVIRVIRRMKESGRCVAVVVHDLNMLPLLCDRALLVHGGRIAFSGTSEECLQSRGVEEAFGVKILSGQGVSFAKR